MKWAEEMLQNEALKYNNRTDFQKKSKSAYKQAYKLKILDKITKHMPKRAGTPKNFKWSKENVLNEALKYIHKTEFIEKSSGAYAAALRLNIVDEACKHMRIVDTSGSNSKHYKYTHETLILIALKYKTKYEFIKNDVKAYNVAWERGVIDDICSHMPKRVFKKEEELYNFKWSFEKIKNEALKYNTRTEFYKNSKSAYQRAVNTKVLDKICKHMKKSSNVSIAEDVLFNKIKNIYPTTQKLRDRKVNIPNQPYIKGFEIDIYIPELHKGIEFDGRYWHSFEIMRKSKNKSSWPSDDLKNYHSIKDEYFRQKGIKILHISENDWNNDPTQSLKKILDFLGHTENG